MPLFETAQWLAAALAFAGTASFFFPTVRRRLGRPRPWLVIASGALLLSAASWFVAEEDWGGTLRIRRHGWPKFYSIECLSPDCAGPGGGVDLLYFLGNSFFYAAILLSGWTLLLLLTSRKG